MSPILNNAFSWLLICCFSLACTPKNGPKETQRKYPTSPSDFHIVLNMSYTEFSKDTHQYNYRIKFDGSSVTYYGPFGDCIRGQCPHREIVFGVDDHEIEQIEKLLAKHNLLTSFSEINSEQTVGQWVETSITITRQHTTWRTTVQGMTKIWGTQKQNSTLTDEARKQIRAITAIQNLFTRFAQRYLLTAL